jgi:hypothetical protein
MTYKQALKLMDEGHLLCHAFFTKKTEWSIDKNRISYRTAKIILLQEGVKLKSMDFSGITKHYYHKKP